MVSKLVNIFIYKNSFFPTIGWERYQDFVLENQQINSISHHVDLNLRLAQISTKYSLVVESLQ